MEILSRLTQALAKVFAFYSTELLQAPLLPLLPSIEPWKAALMTATSAAERNLCMFIVDQLLPCGLSSNSW